MCELEKILYPVPPNKSAVCARASTRGADCSLQDGKPSLQIVGTGLTLRTSDRLILPSGGSAVQGDNPFGSGDLGYQQGG